MSDHEEPFFLLMSKNQMLCTYLVTYSQADNSKFPTRESFGAEIAKIFDMGSSKAKTDYWACGLESQKEGGDYYHVSVELSCAKRWLGVKNHLYTKYKIPVNSSDKHDNYYTAFKYISKSNENVWTSLGHPNLKEVGSPRTKQCINAYRKISKEKKRAANNEQNSEQQISKTVKRKSLADYPIWMYQNLWLKIKSKVKSSSLQLLMNGKKKGKKILQIFFYLA